MVGQGPGIETSATPRLTKNGAPNRWVLTLLETVQATDNREVTS